LTVSKMQIKQGI